MKRDFFLSRLHSFRYAFAGWAYVLRTQHNTWIYAVASPRQHPLAKVGKDVGAAAVLLSALAAVLVGSLVLGPPLWARLSLLF